MIRAKFAILFWVAVSSVLFVDKHSLASADDLAVVDHHYVSRARVGRSFYNYTYTISVNNSAEALANVVATATSTTSNTQIIQGVVAVGSINAGATVQSTETLIFRQNRRVLFNPDSIVWTFTADPADPTNTAPVANAGADQSVVSGALVQLDGTASTDGDGDAITYAWILTAAPSGSSASLSGPFSAMPQFTADLPGDYVAQLVVNDGAEDSAPDTITISTSNSPPVADAGLDQTAPVGATIFVFGGASNDANGDPLTFSWSLASAPTGSAAALSSLADVQTSFVVDVAGEYVVELVVNDGFDNSAPDTAIVTTENTPPVADAGLDQAVEVGDPVALDGTFSFDIDDDPLTYLWSLISIPEGSQAFIADAMAATADFVADLEGMYIAQLIVNDGMVDSDPDTGVVTATVGNQAPTAVAAADNTSVSPGAIVQLDGSASNDPEDNPLTYLWSLAIPNGSSAALSSLTDISPNFTTDVAGTYVATLVVNDGELDSEVAAVVVSAGSQSNTAPQLVPIGNRVMNLGATLEFRLFAIDPDVGDTLTFSLPSPIDGISINGATGDVAFTPTAAQLGTNDVTARVEDSAGLFDMLAFSIEVRDAITVVPQNDPPSLDSFGNQTVIVGETLSVQAVGTDTDGTAQFLLPLSPAGMTISASGLIEFTPTADQVGLHDVTVQVSDDVGASVFQRFVVTVNDVDSPPVAFDDIYTARIGDTLNVAAPGILANDNDPNGDPLIATLLSNSTEGELNVNVDGSFSYRPPTPINLIVPTPVSGNLAQLVEPVRFETSSYRNDDSPGLAIDGDPLTSWFSEDGDAANLGSAPFYELVFPSDVTVTDLEMDGNRDPADGFDFLEGVFQLFDSNGNELFSSGNVALAAPDRDISFSVGSVDGVKRVRFTGTQDESLSSGFSELRVLGSAVVEAYKFVEGIELTKFGPIDFRSSPPRATSLLGGTEFAVDQSEISFWWDEFADDVDPFYEITLPAAEATVSEVQVIVRRNRANGLPITFAAPTSARISMLDSAGATVFDSGLMEGLVEGEDVILAVPDVENVRTVRFDFVGGDFGVIVGEFRIIGDGFVWPIRPQLEWSWDGSESATAPGGANFGQVSVTPTSADLDGDGFMEIIFVASASPDGGCCWPGYLVVLDGRTGDEVAIIDDPALQLDGPSSLAVGDIDDDGLPEIIATGVSIRELIAFEHDLSVKWRSEAITGTIWGSIAIANIDGEGLPEIIAGRQVLNADGQVLWSGNQAPGSHSIAADLDLDGQMEVLAGAGVYSSDGTFLWRNLLSSPGVGVGNFDDDPFAEVVVTGRNTVQVFEHDGTMKWSKLSGDTGGGPPSIADYDGDGKPEIGQIAFRTYTVYDTDGRIMWQMPVLDGSASTTSTVFDLDGNGSAEVIMRDEDFFRIYRGTDGELLFQMQISSSTGGEGPMVADIDSDGQAEIVVGSTESSRFLGRTKGLFVFGGFDGDWVRTREIWNQHTYHVTNVNTDLTIPVVERNNWLTPGLNNFRQQGYSPDDLDRLESFTYRAVAAGQESNTAAVMIDSQAPNAPPEITSTPNTAATIGFEYLYAVSASDTDFDPLTFSLPEGPGGMSIDPPTGLIRWTPADSDAGDRFVTVSVTDPGGQFTSQRFSLSASGGVIVPDVVGQTRTSAESEIVAANLRVGNVRFSDHPSIPAGSVASQTPPSGSIARFQGSVDLLVSTGAGPADIDDDGDGFTENLGDCSDTDPSIFPGATDIAGDGIDQDCDGNDAAIPPAEILVTPAISTVLTGQTVALNALGIYDDGTSQNLSGIVTWTNGPLFSSPTAGSFSVGASFAGVSGSATVDVVASVSDDVTAPAAEITSPSDDAEVTEPVNIIGTASDENFLRYELAYAVVGENESTVLATGAAPVVDGVLGRFDPSMLMNDLYTLRLTVFDTGGNALVSVITVQVNGNLKVGNFSLGFNDLQVPVSGIPITVTRTYDSRDKRSGDFGVGWRIGISSISVNCTDPLGEGWFVAKAGFSFGLFPTRSHRCAVNIPGRRSEVFEFVPSTTISPIVPFFFLRGSFQAQPGTLGTLETALPIFLAIADPQPGAVNLVNDSDFLTFAPSDFVYTSEDGARLTFNANGLQSIEDKNGNRLTFSPDGISHSSGKSIATLRDAAGRISSLTDPEGVVQTYRYSAAGDLTAHVDQLGNETRYFYDRSHGLLRIEDPLGRSVVRNEYDADGRLRAITDAAGNRTEFDHDLAAMRTTETDALGESQTMVFDDRGNVLTRQRSATIEGVLTPIVEQFEYDENDNEVVTIDAAGVRSEFTYDESGNETDVVIDAGGLNQLSRFTYGRNSTLTSVIGPGGTTTTVGYDAAGNFNSITNPSGDQTEVVRNSRGLVTNFIEATGTNVQYQHDADGNVIAIRTMDSAGTIVEEALSTYDALGRQTSRTTLVVIDGVSESATEQSVYDAAGNVIREIDATGNETQFEYNVVGQLTVAIDALGNRTEFTYDEVGNQTEVRRADGSVLTAEYDVVGRRTSETDPLGRTTRFRYDEIGRLVETEFPDGSSMRQIFSVTGELVATVDARGNRTDYEFDSLGRRTRTIDAQGATRSFEYGTSGRLEATIDALGRRTELDLNDVGHLVGITHPDGTTASFEYDVFGRPTSSVDELGRLTTIDYDGAGRPTQVTDPMSGVSTFSYDSAGRIMSRTDANGRTTRMEYDLAGRPAGVVHPGGIIQRQTWDAAGRTIGITNGRSEQIGFELDALGRRTAKILPDGERVTFEYDAADRLLSTSNDEGTITHAYDDLDRLIRSTQPSGGQIEYAYDLAGNIELIRSTVDGDVREITYSWDTLNRLASVSEPGVGLTQFTYDANGGLTLAEYPNGMVTEGTYDARNRPISITHRNSAGVIAAYTATRDAVGDILEISETGGAVSQFGYDENRRLIAETQLGAGNSTLLDRRYGYDAVGNRTLTQDLVSGLTDIATYDVANRLLASQGVAYTYDESGNLLTKSNPSGNTTFGWSSENRLLSATGPAGLTEYSYDALGRRIRRSNASGEELYLVDEGNPTGLQQVLDVIDSDAGTRSAGNTFAFGPLATTNTEGTSYYHNDLSSSVRLRSNGAAEVIGTDRRSVFGEDLSSTGDSGPYKFKSEQLDPSTGLYFVRARYYDPETARFISRDPFPGNPGKPQTYHPYQFSFNNPNSFSDPTGLTTVAEFSVTNAIQGVVLGIRNAVSFGRTVCSAKGVADGVELLIIAGQLGAGLLVPSDASTTSVSIPILSTDPTRNALERKIKRKIGDDNVGISYTPIQNELGFAASIKGVTRSITINKEGLSFGRKSTVFQNKGEDNKGIPLIDFRACGVTVATLSAKVETGTTRGTTGFFDKTAPIGLQFGFKADAFASVKSARVGYERKFFLARASLSTNKGLKFEIAGFGIFPR